MGLKEFRATGADRKERKDSWNHPNKKAQAKLARRQKAFDEAKSKDSGVKRPGSLNAGKAL